jgi:DNA-binding MarR family transcriptional regulator
MPTAQEIDRCVKALIALESAVRLCDEQTAASFGVTSAQLVILVDLERHDRRSVNELAESLKLHQSSVSTTAAKLFERGLIKRARSHDGRRTEMQLTARGRNIAVGAGITGRPITEAAMGRMTPRTLLHLARHMNRLGQAMLEERRLAATADEDSQGRTG